MAFNSVLDLKTVEKYPEHDAFMSQTPQKHLEKFFFQVIMTTKIHFFDLQNFLDFAQLDRKKVTPQPSRALRKFSGHSTHMMWVLKTLSKVRAFKRILSHVRTTHTDKTAPYILNYGGDRDVDAPIGFYFSNLCLHLCF